MAYFFGENILYNIIFPISKVNYSFFNYFLKNKYNNLILGQYKKTRDMNTNMAQHYFKIKFSVLEIVKKNFLKEKISF